MRIEARTLTEQRNILEQAERDAKQQAEVSMRELGACRLRSSELETQSDTLQHQVREMKKEKEELERALLELNEQLLSLRGLEKEAMVAAEHDRKQEEIHKLLKEELQSHQETYQGQVTSLQEEITAKEQLIAQLQE